MDDIDKNEYVEFFREFGDLLNKYNFMISGFTLGKAVSPEIKLVQFNSDGKTVSPVYEIPDGWDK